MASDQGFSVPPIPKELIEALESGEITRDQLIKLIELEAEALELSFDEAVALADQDKLPKSTIGLDLNYLIRLLDATPAAAT